MTVITTEFLVQQPLHLINDTQDSLSHILKTFITRKKTVVMY